MPQFFAYCDDLDAHPPLHLLVAAFVGFKPRRAHRRVAQTGTVEAPGAAEMFLGLIGSQWVGTSG